MKIKLVFSIIILAFLCVGNANAQVVVLTAQEAVLSVKDKTYFDQHIRNQNYAVFALDTGELLDSLRTNSYCNVQLYIDEQWNWEFYLVPDKRWTGVGGVTCEGKTTENEDIILSIDEFFFMGLIFSKRGDIRLDMTRYYTLNRTDKSLIVYKVGDFFENGIIYIDETENDFPVVIYPNPASNILNINYNIPPLNEERLMISIYDMQGQVVKICETTEPNSSLNIDDITDGIYFIRISFFSNKTSRTVKMIVKK